SQPSPSGRRVIVETVNLTKWYTNFWGRKTSVKPSLSNLNLNIYEGEVFGLMGPNGSGKSTTIKLLLGLIHPTSGTVKVMNQPPTNVDVKKYIGYLPEETYLYRFLNARETLRFYGRLHAIPEATLKTRIEELIELVNLGHAGDRPMGQFSKGMGRRLGLAQALINDPQFVIFDEPTSGLDPIGIAEVKHLIVKLKQRGKTVLLSSHLLDQMEEVCDRITMLHLGVTRVDAKPVGEVLSDRTTYTIEAHNISPATLTAVRELIQREGGQVPSVGNSRRSLENLFLNIVKGEEDEELAPGAAPTPPSVAAAPSVPPPKGPG
ncbi:MAG TPA: ABC transporter ATP-binding protein, partial [Planctomycetota bacterium]|nr:ABC transporter ATP-binding protein [Planctomycetota bacterium]